MPSSLEIDKTFLYNKYMFTSHEIYIEKSLIKDIIMLMFHSNSLNSKKKYLIKLYLNSNIRRPKIIICEDFVIF